MLAALGAERAAGAVGVTGMRGTDGSNFAPSSTSESCRGSVLDADSCRVCMRRHPVLLTQTQTLDRAKIIGSDRGLLKLHSQPLRGRPILWLVDIVLSA